MGGLDADEVDLVVDGVQQRRLGGPRGPTPRRRRQRKVAARSSGSGWLLEAAASSAMSARPRRPMVSRATQRRVSDSSGSASSSRRIGPARVSSSSSDSWTTPGWRSACLMAWMNRAWGLSGPGSGGITARVTPAARADIRRTTGLAWWNRSSRWSKDWGRRALPRFSIASSLAVRWPERARRRNQLSTPLAGQGLLQPVALLALDRFQEAEHRVHGHPGQPPPVAGVDARLAGAGEGQADPPLGPLVELVGLPAVPHVADEVVGEQVQAEQGQGRGGRDDDAQQDALDRGRGDAGRRCRAGTTGSGRRARSSRSRRWPGSSGCRRRRRTAATCAVPR